ncbi:MAG: tetratricopeptide repeat protein [Phycisphaerae bacterium]|nr:tetratricopeptide repeat protein [Phycisphaerae bacterium]
MTEVSAELPAFFDIAELTTEAIESYREKVHESFNAWERFYEFVGERIDANNAPPLNVALGLCFLGRFREALEWFDRAPDSGFRYFHAAEALVAIGRYDDALVSLDKAAKQGWEGFAVDMRAVGIHVRKGALDKAQSLIEKHARVGEDRADWYAAHGMVCEYRDEREKAIQLYERALTLQPEHELAAFRCAWVHDMHGNDEEAIRLYESLATRPCAHINALMNLAVVYEDHGNFNAAYRCVQRVLRFNPNHTRARLFLKDIDSSRQMIIDDTVDERLDARSRLLDAPISEFELSVRARNCLKKMSINSLGQLIQLTESELLAYKNFGEASLNEIKQLLGRKGLRLGQRPEEIDPATISADDSGTRVVVPPGREALLAKPVSEMELSVRSRRCLQRLNVVTLGDVIQHSEQDLLSTRNFGVTSLNEIKARLAEIGLSLAPKQAE